MMKRFRDKIAFSGMLVLIIGVALLIFTFISAFGFLTESFSIIASQDLVRTFGEALAPLIATCIRIMYLGVMGWIGSLLTIRGVTVIAHAPKTMQPITQKKRIIKPTPQKTRPDQPKEKIREQEQKTTPTKEEPRPQEPEDLPKHEPSPEPEILVIPPESAPRQQQSEEERRQESGNPQQQPSY